MPEDENIFKELQESFYSKLILSFDGGGVRGRMQNKFMQIFCQLFGIDGKDLWKLCSVIAGTSIGGIQALAYALGLSPQETESFFLEYAKRIFTIRTVPIGCDANSDSNRPNTAQKLALIIASDPFYKSACPPDGYSNYGSNILHDVLVDTFGTATLNDLKTKVIIPSYQYETKKYVVFSNIDDPMFVNNNTSLVDVALATSAAPVYFPDHSINSIDYGDGGLYQNNPAQMALAAMEKIHPTDRKYCLMSLGTGLGEASFNSKEKLNLKGSDSAIERIFSLFNIASTGAQESVDFCLKMKSQAPLANFYYYRFQPQLDPDQNAELDNSDPEFLQYLSDVAVDTFTNDEVNINKFIAHVKA